MAETKHVLLLTEDADLQRTIRPIDQWVNLHAPGKPVDALENVKEFKPDIFLIDARVMSTMVIMLLSAIRNLPKYRLVPLIILGDSPQAKRIESDLQVPLDLNLRRLEEHIADLLKIRLVGRGSHGPHRGSVY